MSESKLTDEDEFKLVSRLRIDKNASIKYHTSAADYSLRCAAVMVRIFSMIHLGEVGERGHLALQYDFALFGEIVSDLIEDAQGHYDEFQVKLTELGKTSNE